MLGHLLEFSVAAQSLAPSYEFYSALGLQPIPVGDVLGDRYVALHGGDVTIGLHERDQPTPALTFVRPQLRDYVRALRRHGIALEHAALADDEFHRVGFSDPDGQALLLLEARTFPPPDWNPQNVTACGRFVEYAVATGSLERSRAYWHSLGFGVTDERDAPHRALQLAGRGLVLGLHEAHFHPGLVFRAPQLASRIAYLRAKGLRVEDGAPLAAGAAATLRAPDGLAVYLLDADE